MFHLLSSIYTDLTTRRRFNALFLGGPSSGKTTLLAVLKQNHVDAAATTTATAQQREGAGGGKRREVGDLPKTRPTVGQNVLDIVAPALPAAVAAASAGDERAEGSSSSSSTMRGLQQIWPRPVSTPSATTPTAASKSSSSWFSSSSSPSHAAAAAASAAIRTSSLIHIWDLGGDPTLRSIWREYYKEAHAVVFFWDVGSGREEQWETLRGVVAEEREMRGRPVLVVWGRGDRVGVRQAGDVRRRAGEEEGKEKGIEVTAASRAPQVEDEHGDLSLSMDDPRRGPSDVDGDGAISSADDEAPAVNAEDRPGRALSPTAATPLARAQTQDDVLESLKAFLESQIEAHVVEGIGNSSIRSDRSTRLKQQATSEAAAAGNGEGEEQQQQQKKAAGEDEDDEEGEQGDAYTDDDEEEEEQQDGPPLLFPPTTLLPLSLVEGYGEQDVMRWIIARSLEAAAEASR